MSPTDFPTWSPTSENKFEERETLDILYATFGGKDWYQNATHDYCHWKHITCTDGKEILKLDLSSQSLEGTIPSEIGDFKSLTTLNLNDNSLTSSIPVEISNLAQLEILNLGKNKLKGSIPKKIIKELTQLRAISLNGNKLKGSIPSRIGKLTYLRYLNLNDNDLDGSIPSDLGDSKSLLELELNENKLSGPIPLEIYNVTSLWKMDLSDNELTGSLAKEIKHLSSMRLLYLAKNNLNGTIPMEIGKLKDLTNLNLSKNYFDGKIPPNLFDKLDNIEEMNLSRNQLTGPFFPMTEEKVNLSNLKILKLDKNYLIGTLPSFLPAVMYRLNELTLSQNKRMDKKYCFDKKKDASEGCERNDSDHWCCRKEKWENWQQICSRFFKKKKSKNNQICLPDTGLYGHIPVEMASFRYLDYFDISDNSVTGTIPAELGSLPLIRHIDLSKNSLSGTIPEQLASIGIEANILIDSNSFDEQSAAPVDLCLLKDRFDISKNHTFCPPERNDLKSFFDQAKGDEWESNANWTDQHSNHCDWEGISCDEDSGKVTSITLANNKLSGVLSPNIGNLTSLVKLDLSNNDIESSLPEEIGKLSNLTYLKLSSNSLLGEVPATFVNLQHLELFQVQENKLTGTIEMHSLPAGIYSKSSMVADCGSPSIFEHILVCDNCTICCNSLGECHTTEDEYYYKESYILAFIVGSSVLACVLMAGLSFIFVKKRGKKNMETFLRKTGEESIYTFILGESYVGWLLAAFIVVIQIFVLQFFLKNSILEFDNITDYTYSWNCPVDNVNCRDSNGVTIKGWLIFAIVMFTKIFPDIYAGMWVCYYSPQVRTQKGIQCFLAGTVLFVISVLSVVVSGMYNYATAREETDLIINSMVILFVNDLDEQLLKACSSAFPVFVDEIIGTILCETRDKSMQKETSSRTSSKRLPQDLEDSQNKITLNSEKLQENSDEIFGLRARTGENVDTDRLHNNTADFSDDLSTMEEKIE